MQSRRLWDQIVYAIILATIGRGIVWLQAEFPMERKTIPFGLLLEEVRKPDEFSVLPIYDSERQYSIVWSEDGAAVPFVTHDASLSGLPTTTESKVYNETSDEDPSPKEKETWLPEVTITEIASETTD